jgi:cell division protein FtsA
MHMKISPQYIIHIGTVQVTCLKVIRASDGTKKIAAFSTCNKPEGFDRGVVKDMPRAAETLRKTLQVVLEGEHETMVRAQVVVSHSHLKNFTFGSSLYFYGNPHALTMKDVREVIAQTRSIATIPLNEIVIQAVPQEFLVNDLSGIYNPIGLEATRLGVSLRLFTLDYPIYNNLQRTLERSDVDVTEFIPSSLGSANAVLTREEKDEGVVLVEVGGFSTRFACYKNSTLVKSHTIPYGSEMITEVLANQFNLKMENARRLKETFVSAQTKPEFLDELVPVEDQDGKERRPIARRQLEHEVQPVIQQLITHIAEAIHVATQESAPVTQAVFTGGGSKLDGFLDVMQNHVPYSLRLGLPRNLLNLPSTLLDAAYADVVGAVDYSSLLIDSQSYYPPVRNVFTRAVDSVKRWVADYF